MTLQEQCKENLKNSVIGIAEELETLAGGDYEELAEYLEDVLDVEIKIDVNFRYRGVVLQLAFGGPNIYFNSKSGDVIGLWGCNQFTWRVKSFACDAVDDYYEDYYESCR